MYDPNFNNDLVGLGQSDRGMCAKPGPVPLPTVISDAHLLGVIIHAVEPQIR